MIPFSHYKRKKLLYSFKVSALHHTPNLIYIILATKKVSMRVYFTFMIMFLTGTLLAQDFNKLYDEGSAAFARGEYNKATDLFGKALLKGSNNKEKVFALASLAYSQQAEGKLQYALESYDKAIEIAGAAPLLLLHRAKLYIKMDSTDKAISDFCSVLKVEPNNKDALLGRAHAYTDKEEFPKALDDYRNLLTIYPKEPAVRLGMIRLYQAEGRLNEAILLANLLIEEFPNNAACYIARSDIERELGQHELALMDVEEAIRIEPDNASHYTLQSILYRKLGKESAAIKSERTADELSKKHGEKGKY